MTTPHVSLAHFRAELYQTFGLRRDALTDLLDAVLTSDRVTSLVRLSLAPAYQHAWPSVFDALSDGTVDVTALRRHVHGAVAQGIEHAGPRVLVRGRQAQAHQAGDPVTGEHGIKQIGQGVAAQPEGLVQFGTKVRQRDVRGRHNPRSISASAHFRPF